MIALELTDIKDFMKKLLLTETFDNFLLQEAVITNNATYTINGQITKDFYTTEELEYLGINDYRFLPFSILRNRCFDLIKGKRTPLSFRFVFLLSPQNMQKTIASIGSSYTQSDISGIYINLKYQKQQLFLTTGISYNIFSIDKTLEKEWDTLVMKFLKQHEIPFEEMQ